MANKILDREFIITNTSYEIAYHKRAGAIKIV